MGVQFKKELLIHDNEGQWHIVEKYQHGQNSTAYGPYDSEDRCFYCSQHLSGEAVLFWMGSNTRSIDTRKNPNAPLKPWEKYDPPSWRKETSGGHDLLLHPGCFLEMTTRLFSDLHRIESIVDYHLIKNSSPRPPRPVDRTDGDWKVWRKLRDAMRDLSVVNQ